jgi:hypothetical protein
MTAERGEFVAFYRRVRRRVRRSTPLELAKIQTIDDVFGVVRRQDRSCVHRRCAFFPIDPNEMCK